MSKTTYSLDKLSVLLDNLYYKAKEKLVDLWWLDQGETPIIQPITISIESGKTTVKYLPKSSLSSALRKLKENIELLSKLDLEERIQILDEILEFSNKLYLVFDSVIDANMFVKEAEKTLYKIKSKLGGRSEEYRKIHEKVYNLIKDIKEIFLRNPLKWTEEKESYKRTLKKIIEEAKGILTLEKEEIKSTTQVSDLEKTETGEEDLLLEEG